MGTVKSIEQTQVSANTGRHKMKVYVIRLDYLYLLQLSCVQITFI